MAGARPPLDPELEKALDALPASMRTTLTLEAIPARRTEAVRPSVEELIAGRPIEVTDHIIPGYGGAEIGVSVLRRTDHSGAGAGVFHVHGGGMVTGDRWAGAENLADWVDRYDVVGATIEYRLAPEFPDPVPVEDCYAGLVWFSEYAGRLGVDPERLVVSGRSAGGGLCAGIVLLARDRRGPAIRAQLLMCPMLDDRDATRSSEQFDGPGLWNRGSNRTGWTALLGDRRGGDRVSICAAPARAEDLSGLPPTYVDVGSAEVFRDEDVAYATRIWAAGGRAELHVWPGGYHGFDRLVPDAALSVEAVRTRETWLRRHLAVGSVSRHESRRIRADVTRTGESAGSAT